MLRTVMDSVPHQSVLLFLFDLHGFIIIYPAMFVNNEYKALRCPKIPFLAISGIRLAKLSKK